jgi:methylase of polypeptide subunit release factors
MKFDVIVGNPPFSKVSEGKTAGKRSEELYIQFYKWAVSHADIVAMVMPTTDKKLQKTHNTLLRDTANMIKYVDTQHFPEITMPMWYVIANKQDPARAQIDWCLDGSSGNDVPWVKGYINMTAHKNAVGDHLGYDTPKKKSDVCIYHKVNITHGLVTLYCDQQHVSVRALFPKTGWAVLMPQTFNDDGWSKTEIVKCTGKQAAFNGMNIVFVDTKTQGEKLVEYMKTDVFIQAANKVKQGFNNMNLSCLKAMKLDKSFKKIIA